MRKPYKDVLSSIVHACTAHGIESRRIPQMVLGLDMIGYAGIKGFVERIHRDKNRVLHPLQIEKTPIDNQRVANLNGESILYYMHDIVQYMIQFLTHTPCVTLTINNTTDRLMILSELGYVANQGYDIHALLGRTNNTMWLGLARYTDFPHMYSIDDSLAADTLVLSFSRSPLDTDIPQRAKNITKSEVLLKRYNDSMVNGIVIDTHTWQSLVDIKRVIRPS